MNILIDFLWRKHQKKKEKNFTRFNRLFRLESWFNVRERMTWTFLFNSCFVNCLIDNHHWKTLNADSSTRLSWWNRFHHWCYVNRQYTHDDIAFVKKKKMWSVRERDNFIFFTDKKSKDFIDEKYEIKKTSKKFARHVLMILLHEERNLWWFII
jgi:hypothetical protein